MKIQHSILAVCMLTSVIATAGTFRVATLNVNAGICSSSNALAAIRSSAADVVLLQEPNPLMMSGLRNALREEYSHSDLARPGHDHWYYIDRLGILSKHPFEARFIHPEADGAFGSQLAVIHTGNVDIQLLNVHLAPPGLISAKLPLRTIKEFMDSESKRVTELKLLLSQLNPDFPAVVAGDFNSLPGSATIATMLSHGFTDTHNTTTNPPPVSTWRDEIEGVPLSLRIDYIFCDDAFTTITNGVLPCASSDHALIFSEMEIKTESRQQSPGSYPRKAADGLPANGQE
jgi:endonuclease/exonuclease/phosphatase (EEP) superfamily protein YafD